MMIITVLSVFAAVNKKKKVLDHYYLDSEMYLCEWDFASFEVTVYEVGDSIKLESKRASSGLPVSLETFEYYTDSVQVRWGTQEFYNVFGNLKRWQFIDTKLGIETTKTYDDNGSIQQLSIFNSITNERDITAYYKSGAKKSNTKTVLGLDGIMTSEITGWYEDGQLLREQKLVNNKTVALKMYETDGRTFLRIPCQKGDTIFLTKEGNASAREKTVNYGVIDIDGDSIKISIRNKNGRLLGIENYMSYTPENAVTWGMQRYFFTTTEQPRDSVVLFRSVLGDNLVENLYYEDGKIKSTTNTIYNNVMLRQKEFKQFYPSGVLRRIERYNGEDLVEGHIYDKDGKETFPFYKFQP